MVSFLCLALPANIPLDPLDSRNHGESVCRQVADPARSPGMVAREDQHTYDFPDLLPRSLGFVDSDTDFFPQLEVSFDHCCCASDIPHRALTFNRLTSVFPSLKKMCSS